MLDKSFELMWEDTREKKGKIKEEVGNGCEERVDILNFVIKDMEIIKAKEEEEHKFWQKVKGVHLTDSNRIVCSRCGGTGRLFAEPPFGFRPCSCFDGYL